MQEGMQEGMQVAVESLVHSFETAIRFQCIGEGFLGQEHPWDQISWVCSIFSHLEWSEYWWAVPSGQLCLKWTLEISVSGAILDEDIPRLRSEPPMLKLAAEGQLLMRGLESHHFRKCLENCSILMHSAPKSSSPVAWHASPTLPGVKVFHPASGVFVRPKYFSSKLQVVAFTNKVRVAKPETKKTWRREMHYQKGDSAFPEVGWLMSNRPGMFMEPTIFNN